MIYYIYKPNDPVFVQSAKDYLVDRLKEESVSYISIDVLDSIDVSSITHLIVSGDEDEIKRVILFANTHNLSVGIIPSPTQLDIMRTFDLPSKIEDALSLALVPLDKKIDLLYCNDTLVLQEVVIGDAPPLSQFENRLKNQNMFQRVGLFWQTMTKIHKLTHTQMKITHSKDQETKLSAVGVVGLIYSNATFASNLLSKELNSTDGRVTMVILSPISVVQYMRYLFRSLVSHIRPKTLPKSVGYIQSNNIQIETKKPLKVAIDSSESIETPISLRCEKQALALSVGEKFWTRQSKTTSSKDSIKIDHLPRDEESSNYLSKAIPLFSHASQEQYSSLFRNLREEGILNSTFMILLILATMIATFGLFINSGSVIIGAMLLAPLMQPIVSLSMGVLRQDNTMQINGIKTIVVGVLAVLLTSAIIALFTPIERLTTEMIGRLSPTILDLFVAIVSGVAAGYAKSNEKILSSLAGVAIAVALVPPIAVAGIGLGWGDWSMFSSAFLLFITNLVGIVLATAFTFMLLGFSPLHLAKKGIIIWLLIVSIVSIPLYSSFNQMRDDIEIQKRLSNLNINIEEHNIKLTQIEIFRQKPKAEIRCQVISTGVLTKTQKTQLKESILQEINQEADIIVTFRYLL